MNVEVGAEDALFPEKEYINGIAVAVCCFTYWTLYNFAKVKHFLYSWIFYIVSHVKSNPSIKGAKHYNLWMFCDTAKSTACIVRVLALALLSHISSLWRSSKNVYKHRDKTKIRTSYKFPCKGWCCNFMLVWVERLPPLPPPPTAHSIAKTLYRKFETNIPRKGTSRPQYQFLHSCFCDRFIYSHKYRRNRGQK